MNKFRTFYKQRHKPRQDKRRII